jgi:Flp pilus assembly pilin Flp
MKRVNHQIGVVKELLLDEEGASLVEYILLGMMIAAAAIAGVTFVGKAADNRMNNIGATIQNG